MTPEQALQIVNQATAQANLNRESHQTVLKALEVLDKALKKPQDKNHKGEKNVNKGDTG